MAMAKDPKKPAPKKTLAGVVGVACCGILLTIVPAFEGTEYVGYRDPIGIPTKCMGDTYDVKVGKRYSFEECQASLHKQLIKHAEPVLACVPSLRNRPKPLAASVDLAYNIGTSGFCRSTAARKFNAGDYAGGCRALGAFTKAGGRVLPGLVRRRKAEVKLCLEGLPNAR